MTQFTSQVSALFAKNFKIYTRSKKSLFKDLLLPIITAIYILSNGFETQQLLPAEVLLPLSLLGHVRAIMVDIVTDKSDKYKEYLKINGVTLKSYHFSNLLFGYFKVLIFTMITCSGFFFLKSQYLRFSPIGITCLYFFTGIATTHMALFLTCFFSTKELSADLGGFIYTILSFVYLAAVETKINIWYYVSLLFPQNALSFALISHTKQSQHLTFDALTASIFLVLDSVIYLMAYFYFDEVLPDQFGVKRDWNYCIEGACDNKSHEKGDDNVDDEIEGPHENTILMDYMQDSSSEGDVDESNIRGDQSSALYHQEIKHAKVGARVLRMINVSRSFGADKVINGLELNFYEKEVFCLLGHNGAGKTTIINMLTGILDTNDGQIIYYSVPIKKVLQTYRQQIGLCSQQDILYRDLTCDEHLKMIGKIKGLFGAELEEEVDKIIERLGMESEANKKVREMSGGNKRKLSLALSILGESKIIFLDEPTSGLDPQSRRFVWDIIIELKNEGKTIILTTHHLDEAEHLADRLAIMTKGNLFAVGTPTHIKKKFGIGYHLTITPNYENEEEGSSKNLKDVQPKIQKILNSHIPSIKCDENTLDTLKYLLPFDQLKSFPTIFEELEQIKSIKLNLEMNSLEDAFVNIGLHQDLYSKKNAPFNNPPSIDNLEHAKEEPKDQEQQQQQLPCDKIPEGLFVEPKYSFKKQFKAMFLRKNYATLRNYKYILLIALPILFVIVGVLFGVSKITTEQINTNEAFNKQKTDLIVTFTFLFLVNFAFALNSTVYASFPVLEREKKIKYVLRILGCRTLPYWLGTFAFDMLLITCINIVMMLLVFVLKLKVLEHNFGILFLLMFVYSVAIVTSSYFYGFLFEKSSTVYKSYAAFYFFVLYILPSVLIAVMYQYNINERVMTVFKWITYHMTPLLPFNDALIFLVVGQKVSLVGSHYLFASIYHCIYFFVWLAFLFGVLTIIVDKIKNRDAKQAEEPDSPIDSPRKARRQKAEFQAVQQERSRVQYPENDDAIKVLNLRKTYPNGFKALKDVTFGVAKGEIFGLLGPNGAGKSTTFNILTGMIPRTSGNVLLKEQNIEEDQTEIRTKMGICPQFNAMWDNVEVREHLKIFGQVKGMEEKDIKESADFLINAFQMQNSAEKPSGVLSGGTKRKLATAISLINAPEIIFLDEPSTGMDPNAKRCFWNAIRKIVHKKNSSVILTTHSMEEAESLCKKIGILVNGKFMCFGPMSYLKDQYGSGYKVDFTKNDQIVNIDLHVERLFPDCEKQESHANIETYQVPSKSMIFSKVFLTLEGLKMKKIIQDYSIYNTTLEQVFITFAKIQVQNSMEEGSSISSID